MTLRDRALRLLAMREHSRSELARKLADHGEPDEVAELVARLAELGLQSDERFASAYVRAKAVRFGRTRLKVELARRGIAPALIDAALAEGLQGDDPRIGAGSEFSRARDIRVRKYGEAAPGDAREWARQARFLQGRGFSAEIIRRVLKGEPGDEPA